MTGKELLNTLTNSEKNEPVTLIDVKMMRNNDGSTYYRQCVGFGETYGNYAKSPLTFVFEHDEKALTPYWHGKTFEEIFTYVNKELKGLRVIKSPKHQ